MKPEVMTSEVSTSPAAHAQRERRTGSMTRMPESAMSVKPAAVPYLAQSIGALYGIGTGVQAESCSASGPASKPLWQRGKEGRASTKRLQGTVPA